MHRDFWRFLAWLLLFFMIFWAPVALPSCGPLRPIELETRP
jgi:hypothetical protein